MKFRIFMLTRNEQRVVVLALLVLLAAAFVHYWHNVQTFPPNKASETTSPAVSLPLSDGSSDDEGSNEKADEAPSPQSPP